MGGDSNALDTVCMDGSDVDVGMEEVEIPYYNHAPQFEEFKEVEGKINMQAL